MPEFQTFSAWIMMNEVRLREYDVQEKTDEKGMRVITCWVASEAGKEFIVRAKETRNGTRPNLSSTFRIDGVRARSSIWEASSTNYDALNSIQTKDGARRLCFAPLQLLDDESASPTVDAHLGEISVQFREVEILESTPPKKAATLSLGNGSVHERCKKAGSHIVQPGSLAAPIPQSVGNKTNAVGAPIVQFIFRYRSLDILRAMQLVSRQTLGPPSVPPKDDVAEFEVGPTEAAIEQESEPCRLHEDGAQNRLSQLPLALDKRAAKKNTITNQELHTPESTSPADPEFATNKTLIHPLSLLPLVVSSEPGSSSQIGVASASTSIPASRKRRGCSPSNQHVDKKPKIEDIDDSNALNAAERRIEKLAAQRGVAEAQMRVAELRLEEIEAKELVSKLKGKHRVQARAPSATPEWHIDESGTIVVD